ncbi:hypothetical protein [Streptomyces sp. NPDC058157]|uniref:hypothetical protein n=1 Tax=Streptomyces sp. NPDC058157 TaxID=3346360 RepID=UPI0036E642B1
MTTHRKKTAGLWTLPFAAVLLLVAGCGTQRAGAAAGAAPSSGPAPSGTAVATPSGPVDFPCPGEGSAPPAPTATDAAPPDRYAENHAFRMPLRLHGQGRCDGLAAEGRVRGALEPLRRSGGFTPAHVHSVLTGLGYPADKVRTYQNGPGGVGFLIDVGASPWCVEGTLTGGSTTVDAFGGYPDGTGCEPPRGGH